MRDYIKLQLNECNPYDPHFINSHLEICSFVISVVDGCVVHNPQLTITFCFDGETLITFCLDKLWLITFCDNMDIYRCMASMLMYGY